MSLAEFWSQSRGVVIRGFILWIFAAIVLLNERQDDFDLRYKLRGSVLKSDQVALLLMNEEEWLAFSGAGNRSLRPLKELESSTDSFYWDPSAWEKLLHLLNRYEPQVIGIAFYFGDQSPNGPLISETLKNSKIIWGSRLDSEGQIRQTELGVRGATPNGLIDIRPDNDGIVRRLPGPSLLSSLFGYEIVKRAGIDPQLPVDTTLINYQGPTGTFLSFTLSELISGTIPEAGLKGKILIIGARQTQLHTVQTPSGPMPRAEMLANMTANFIDKQWIKRWPLPVYLISLAVLLILCIWITTSYPQSVALVVIFIVWSVELSFSAWLFDSYQIWFPIVAPTILIGVTFVVFLSYQLLINERETFQLIREKRYLEEIEEIKNNFLSLISHDLKTPIAKIQAIAERLTKELNDAKVSADLLVIRNSSQDLYRYIQSILQVTRVESTDFQLRKRPGDINELIEKAIEEIRPMAIEKKIEIHSHLEPLFAFEFDPTSMHEVVLNLLENAVKYTPEGGRITVSSAEVGNDIEVHVTDTGDGITPEELPRVWGKFYRGKKHDMTTKGTGLGLYLVRYFVEAHDGEVFLTSELQKGTKIGFKIPQANDSLTEEDE